MDLNDKEKRIMKRPNEYGKPLNGSRTNYHPADLSGEYVKDLNTYIDHLELIIKNMGKIKIPDSDLDKFNNAHKSDVKKTINDENDVFVDNMVFILKSLLDNKIIDTETKLDILNKKANEIKKYWEDINKI